MMIPPDLLRSFASLSETRSFTATARALGLRQSTVSQHIARLETLVGRRLVDRDTHAVSLTPEGLSVLELGRKILRSNDELGDYLSGTALRGRLRFGASEDFVLSALPEILAAFARRHPEVDVEFNVGLSADLTAAYRSGDLDVAVIKRPDDGLDDATLWREPVIWTARPELRVDPARPVPLVIYPAPSVTRAVAIEALNAAGRAWRIAFTSHSLVALVAAVEAGVGVMPLSRRLTPPRLSIRDDADLPRLGAIRFDLLGRDKGDPVVSAVHDSIRQWSGGRLFAA